MRFSVDNPDMSTIGSLEVDMRTFSCRAQRLNLGSFGLHSVVGVMMSNVPGK